MTRLGRALLHALPSDLADNRGRPRLRADRRRLDGRGYGHGKRCSGISLPDTDYAHTHTLSAGPDLRLAQTVLNVPGAVSQLDRPVVVALSPDSVQELAEDEWALSPTTTVIVITTKIAISSD